MKIETNKRWEDRPTEGNFTVVWEYQGEVWSSSYGYDKNDTLREHDTNGDFLKDETSLFIVDNPDKLTFITK